MFRVGQKVVCVDVRPSPMGRPPIELTLNAVYMISYIAPPDIWGDIGLGLVDIEYIRDVFHRPEFNARRFRPVVDRPTDISIFTRMLTDADEKVDA